MSAVLTFPLQPAMVSREVRTTIEDAEDSGWVVTGTLGSRVRLVMPGGSEAWIDAETGARSGGFDAMLAHYHPVAVEQRSKALARAMERQQRDLIAKRMRPKR